MPLLRAAARAAHTDPRRHAAARLADTGRELPATTGERKVIEAAPVDHLADVAEVIRGDKRVRTQVVLARLTDLWPDGYEDWTFGELKAALAEHGVSVAKSDGVKVIRAEDVADAINERDRREER
jgi:S-DNA-T family DNA segregation ATPase FtsK/SpoIIIE